MPVARRRPGSTAGHNCPPRYVTCCAATASSTPCGTPTDCRSTSAGRYIVPAHTRRAILDRDRTCRHPGCTAHTHLQIHHIIEWLQNGMTDTDNLAALCSKHHHAYHRGEFSMAGNPNIAGQLRFYDARGRPIPDTAIPNPPTGPPPQPDIAYTHPTGERFETLWLNLTTN